MQSFGNMKCGCRIRSNVDLKIHLYRKHSIRSIEAQMNWKMNCCHSSFVKFRDYLKWRKVIEKLQYLMRHNRTRHSHSLLSESLHSKVWNDETCVAISLHRRCPPVQWGSRQPSAEGCWLSWSLPRACPNAGSAFAFQNLLCVRAAPAPAWHEPETPSSTQACCPPSMHTVAACSHSQSGITPAMFKQDFCKVLMLC